MTMIEEPNLCNLVSQALNKGHAAALKTSELTAVAVLSGRITLEMEKRLGDTVDYDAMRELVRNELDMWVDEPEFIEMFQTVVELGAGKFSFIKDLIEFGELFVD